MDEASLASGAGIPHVPTLGWGGFHPPPAVSLTRVIAPIFIKSVSNAGKAVEAGPGERHSELPQSTAKRGWIKRCHPAHSAGDRAGPDAAGATRKNEAGPGAARATRNLLRLSSETSERAGRRPARRIWTDMPAERAYPPWSASQATPSGLKSGQRGAETASNSSCCPGLTASIPAALGVQGGEALPRRSLSSGAAGKTATPAEPAWPLGGIGKRCLGGTGVDPARRLAASPFSGSPTAAVASGDAGARGRAAGPAVCPEHRSTRRPTAGPAAVGRAPSTLAPRRRHRS